MLFHIVHVVVCSCPKIGDPEGQWLVSTRTDYTSARARTEQLNEGINLQKHHHYKILTTINSCIGLSNVADHTAQVTWDLLSDGP